MTTLNTVESASERQAAALRAALVLLALVGNAAALYLTFHPPTDTDPWPVVGAMVTARAERSTAADRDAARLADLRAAVAATDATFTEFLEWNDPTDRASITARAVIGGVEFDLWAPLADPATIAAARALVPAAVPAGAAA